MGFFMYPHHTLNPCSFLSLFFFSITQPSSAGRGHFASLARLSIFFTVVECSQAHPTALGGSLIFGLGLVRIQSSCDGEAPLQLLHLQLLGNCLIQSRCNWSAFTFTPALVNLAKAGFHSYLTLYLWIPAFAGMTGKGPLSPSHCVGWVINL